MNTQEKKVANEVCSSNSSSSSSCCCCSIMITVAVACAYAGETDVFERQNRNFIDFLAISGCYTHFRSELCRNHYIQTSKTYV